MVIFFNSWALHKTKEQEETEQGGDEQNLWFSRFKTLETIEQIPSSLNKALLTVDLNCTVSYTERQKKIYKCTSVFLDNTLHSIGRKTVHPVTFFNMKSFYLVYSSTWPHSKDNFSRLSCISDFLFAYYFLSS